MAACRFLNVQGGAVDAGAGLCVWDTVCGANPHNVWRICSVRGQDDPSVVEILSTHAQRYLNLKAGLDEPGADVQLWDSYRDPPNLDNYWKMVPVDGHRDVYEIQSCASGRFLNVRGGSTVAGARVCVWDADFGCNDLRRVLDSASHNGTGALPQRHCALVCVSRLRLRSRHVSHVQVIH
jgi:hypothetical protein